MKVLRRKAENDRKKQFVLLDFTPNKKNENSAENIDSLQAEMGDMRLEIGELRDVLDLSNREIQHLRKVSKNYQIIII